MDQERLENIPAQCEDCGLEYPFPDYVLPDEIWKRIAPQPDGNGLLCPTCIAKRLDAIGLWYQEGYFKPDGYSAFNPLQAEVQRLTSDRDAWRSRAEAAKQDLIGMAESIRNAPSDTSCCFACDSADIKECRGCDVDDCFIWRGEKSSRIAICYME